MCKGVLLFGQGSRHPQNRDMVLRVVRYLEAQNEFGLVIPCFLRFDRPTMEEALETMAVAGIRDVFVAPCMLSAQVRLPQGLDEWSEKVDDDTARVRLNGTTLVLKFCQPIGCDDRLVQVLADSVRFQMKNFESLVEQ